MPETGNVDVVASLVSSLGFPIVICLILLVFIKYLLDTHKNEIIELNKQHSEEMNKMATALENNTKVMTEILLVVKGGVRNG